jgi:hypothetical protein
LIILSTSVLAESLHIPHILHGLLLSKTEKFHSEFEQHSVAFLKLRQGMNTLREAETRNIKRHQETSLELGNEIPRRG